MKRGVPLASRQDNYNKRSYEDIRLRVPKGKKGVIQSRADELNQSINSYIIGAIEKDIQTVRGADFSLTSRDIDE